MFAPPPLPSFSNPFADAEDANITRIAIECEAGDPFEFKYNPTQFSLDRGVSWEDAKAMKEAYGVLNFTGGSSDTISFTAMLDTSEDDSESTGVLKQVKELYAYTKISVEDNNYKRPPILTLTWHSDLKFVGVITALKVDFTMFGEDGTPLRADVTVTMMGRTFAESNSKDTFFAPASIA